MPTFPTPDPILIRLDIAAGDARISAGDRHETVVDVAPHDPSNPGDRRAAEDTRVELADGRLLVKTPRQALSFLRGGSVDVTISAPAGSSVDGNAGAGELRVEGTVADFTFRSGAGDITVERAAGTVNVATGAGAVRIAALEQVANIRSGSGTTSIGAAGGDVRVATANGDITVDRAAGDVVAKTANGSVRVGEVARGSVELSTAHGNIEVGIAEGTAARLDVRTQFGTVHQRLEATGAPPAGAQTVAVRGRTSFGDITVARAPAH
jgi:hypothetical protein